MGAKKYMDFTAEFPTTVTKIQFLVATKYISPKDHDFLITASFYDHQGQVLPLESVAASYSPSLGAKYRDLDLEGAGDGDFLTRPFSLTEPSRSCKMRLYEWRKSFKDGPSFEAAIDSIWVIAQGPVKDSGWTFRVGDFNSE